MRSNYRPKSGAWNGSCTRTIRFLGPVPLLLGYPGVYAKSNEKVRDLMSLSCLLYSSCVPTQWKTNKSGLTR